MDFLGLIGGILIDVLVRRVLLCRVVLVVVLCVVRCVSLTPILRMVVRRVVRVCWCILVAALGGMILTSMGGGGLGTMLSLAQRVSLPHWLAKNCISMLTTVFSGMVMISLIKLNSPLNMVSVTTS